jgi:hypothetical protein
MAVTAKTELPVKLGPLAHPANVVLSVRRERLVHRANAERWVYKANAVSVVSKDLPANAVRLGYKVFLVQPANAVDKESQVYEGRSAQSANAVSPDLRVKLGPSDNVVSPALLVKEERSVLPDLKATGVFQARWANEARLASKGLSAASGPLVNEARLARKVK